MATYKADPFYEVESRKIHVKFDHHGIYETEDQAEIDVLDALCPTWIKRIDSEAKPEESAAETVTSAADETSAEPKPPSRAKTSGK